MNEDEYYQIIDVYETDFRVCYVLWDVLNAEKISLLTENCSFFENCDLGDFVHFECDPKDDNIAILMKKRPRSDIPKNIKNAAPIRNISEPNNFVRRYIAPKP